MQLVFFGSSGFSVPILEALSSEHHLLAVVTQPDRPRGRGRRPQPTPVKSWAKERGFLVLEPEDLGEIKAELERMHPEAFVVAAYGKILPRWLLDLPPYGAINVHPSLLPRYRGAAPIQWAILKGERETGVTTFLMDEGLDSGPILLQRRVPIGEEETASELSRRLSELGSELTLETLRGLQQGRIRPRPQDHQKACYAPKIERRHGLIHWQEAAGRILNLIRALDPWPSAYTFYRGKLLKIWRARVGWGKGRAGEVIGLEGGIEVACGEGSLIIGELQLEGKRRMGAEEFLRGHPLRVGEKLGGGEGT